MQSQRADLSQMKICSKLKISDAMQCKSNEWAMARASTRLPRLEYYCSGAGQCKSEIKAMMQRACKPIAEWVVGDEKSFPFKFFSPNNHET